MTSVTDTSTPLLYQARAALEEWGVMGPFDHALVLGTGLGNIIEDVEGAVQVPSASGRRSTRRAEDYRALFPQQSDKATIDAQHSRHR